MNERFHGYTVAQVIESLSTLDQDAIVVIDLSPRGSADPDGRVSSLESFQQIDFASLDGVTPLVVLFPLARTPNPAQGIVLEVDDAS